MSVCEDIKKGLLEAIDYESGKGPAKVTVFPVEPVAHFEPHKSEKSGIRRD